MVELKKKSLPKHVIPLFTIWIALCNIGAIAFGLVSYFISYEFVSLFTALNFTPLVDLLIIVGINVASLLLLIPLFTSDDVFRFFIPAFGWFILVSAAYFLFGMYWLLAFGGIQMLGDLWYELVVRKVIKNQNN
jgi:hypothetical protein